MSTNDTALARAIERSTAQYDKVRSLDIIHRLGVDVVRQAIQEDEIEAEFLSGLPYEDQIAYQTNYAQLLASDESHLDNEHSPAEQYIDAEIDFDNRVHGLLGKISDTYWFGSVQPNSIWLRTAEHTHATRADDLSMMILRAHVEDGTVHMTKEKRFGVDKQALQVTDSDWIAMMQAAQRLLLVSADIEANG